MVVDGSTDGSFELLQELAATETRLRPILIPNSGEARARLEGVRHARGELVLLLDDDVEPLEGLAGRHAEKHADAEDLVVVGYMPVDEPRSAAVRLYANSYEAHVDRWRSGQQSIIRTLWAGNLSLRREAYLRLAGRPQPSRYDFHADRVFGFECEGIGLRAIFAEDCVARHHYERSLTGLATDARRQGEAIVRMPREYPGYSAPLARDAFTRFLPSWLARGVEFARRPRAGRLVRAGVQAATAALDGIRSPHAVKGADLLAILERQRGAIEASHPPSRPEDGIR